MTFQNESLTTLPSDQRAKRGIGYVPQGRDIFPDMTVLENLRIGLIAQGQGHAPIPDDIYELFPVLRTMLDRKGGVLSGGQQQQLAIARALITRPSLLLLDEPTEGIQPSVFSKSKRCCNASRPAAPWQFYWSSNTSILPAAWRITCMSWTRGRLCWKGSSIHCKMQM